MAMGMGKWNFDFDLKFSQSESSNLILVDFLLWVSFSYHVTLNKSVLQSYQSLVFMCSPRNNRTNKKFIKKKKKNETIGQVG